MASRDPRRPNILFILDDDHGPWALGCAGNSEIRLRRVPDGVGVDAKSLVKVMGLKFRTGPMVDQEAEGEAAEAALDELRALVERDFDETHG